MNIELHLSLLSRVELHGN